jgi:hypothetical protein
MMQSELGEMPENRCTEQPGDVTLGVVVSTFEEGRLA